MQFSDLLSSQLREKGVKFVFGVPGGPSIPYLESLRKAGIQFILTSNEAAAGFMADVTSRLTGIPGICHATFGPGATNLLTGVGGAFLDRSAVIAFTSEMDEDMLYRTAQMNINHQQLFRPVAKAGFRIDNNNSSYIIEESFRIAVTEYPGPVHIGLPVGMASAEVEKVKISASVNEKVVPENNTERIISLLKNAEHPLLAIGLTAFRNNQKNNILKFLEKFAMPVVLTPMAAELVDYDHQCYAGVLFHALSDRLSPLYKKTDLVIGLGYDPVEYNYESWMPDVPLIHFDTISMDLPYNIDSEQYVGDPEEWFKILGNRGGRKLQFDKKAISVVKEDIENRFSECLNNFGPVVALHIIKEEIPGNAIVTADVGSHLHVAGQYWRRSDMGRFLMTNGWSSMGFGIPAALAAKLNNPDLPVVCITGDGGFLMMAGELITARRYNLKIIIVVFADRELNLIKVKQSWKDLAPYGTQLYENGLFGSNIFLGVKVIDADSSQTLRQALREALASDSPVIINAMINAGDYDKLIVSPK